MIKRLLSVPNKRKISSSLGFPGACLYTQNFLSPETRKFLSPGSAIPHSNVLGISDPRINQSGIT